MTAPPPEPNSDNWKSNYFAIFEHLPSCFCVFVCPCVLVGRIVEILDASITSCCTAGCIYWCLSTWTGGLGGWLYTCNYRSRLRAKFGLPEEPCHDCLADLLCCFSITQMYRELLRRGIDPSLGYISNKHKLDPPVQVPAPVLSAPASPGHPIFITYQQAAPAPGFTPGAPQQQPAYLPAPPGPQQQAYYSPTHHQAYVPQQQQAYAPGPAPAGPHAYGQQHYEYQEPSASPSQPGAFGPGPEAYRGAAFQGPPAAQYMHH